MSDKIKILFVAANPTDTGHIRLQEEARDLEERIRQGTERGHFEVIHCFATRARDLLRVLQEVEPHILHFSGHGTQNSEIVLQDDAGISRPVAPQDLADLVELFRSNLKIALLSSCYGRKQAEALHQVLDFTIGMDQPISDAGAVIFSATFYQVLASGGSVRKAFESARILSKIEGRPVFAKSDLLVREGANADTSLLALLPEIKPAPSPAEVGAPAPVNSISIELNDSAPDIFSVFSGNSNTVANQIRRKD